MSEEKRVRIADGSPETLDNLKLYLISSKKNNKDKKLKTLEQAINFAIEQAGRVPELEKEISSLEDKLLESANEIGNLRMRVKELEDKISDLEYQIEAEAYRQQDDI